MHRKLYIRALLFITL